MILDREGELIHTGRYWDPESRKHTSGTGPGERMYSVTPFDVDGDGDLDLILGTDSGGLYVRENVGSKTKPSFDSEYDVLPGAKGAARLKHGYAMPVMVDWDGDGVTDIVSGGKNGGVHWMRNVGAKGAPKFAASKPLLEAARTVKDGVGDRSQVDVVDYDGDGHLDLLVGDYESKKVGDDYLRRANVWLYRNAKTASAGSVAKAEGGQ